MKQPCTRLLPIPLSQIDFVLYLLAQMESSVGFFAMTLISRKCDTMIRIPNFLTDIIERVRARAEGSPLISITEISKLYGPSVRTLRRRQAAGLMPEQIKHGRKKMYRRLAIAEMFSGNDAQGGSN